MTKKTEKKKEAAPAASTTRKQQTLGPGFERKRIPELDDAAEELRQVREKRMSLQLVEEEKQGALDEKCEKHNVTAAKPYVYYDDEEQPYEVYYPDAKPRAKVRKLKLKKEK